MHASSSGRMFGKADAAWFEGMLRNETRIGGVGLRVFETSSGESLREQVENVVQVGFMVGIHGANLVNSMFMRPFGGLMEVQPFGTTSLCYVSGGNSGLAYFRHVASKAASAEESGCGKNNFECETKMRNRMVKISDERDRKAIREYVQKGIQHLLYLHNTFPDGIPVTYNPETAYYDIAQPQRKHSHST